ncbi:MAG TPA: glycosyltransferase family 2 protein, partial [Methylomirabilota bacterium]|nr:glycosyltransferase family 2 protein [Methylomirabilota bacterium]
VFKQVDFDNRSLTEDFDVTLQLHRKKLGKVQFIPKAVAYTQDPLTIKEYTRQITRWNRGGLQSMMRYKIGRSMTRIDAYLSYQILQNLLFFFSYLIFVPYLALIRHSTSVIASAFIVDVMITFILNAFVAIRSRRADVISAFPHVYFLRWVSLAVFLRAFFEVIILRKFRNSNGIWDNSRYVMDSELQPKKLA